MCYVIFFPVHLVTVNSSLIGRKKFKAIKSGDEISLINRKGFYFYFHTFLILEYAIFNCFH